MLLLPTLHLIGQLAALKHNGMLNMALLDTLRVQVLLLVLLLQILTLLLVYLLVFLMIFTFRLTVVLRQVLGLVLFQSPLLEIVHLQVPIHTEIMKALQTLLGLLQTILEITLQLIFLLVLLKLDGTIGL